MNWCALGTTLGNTPLCGGMGKVKQPPLLLQIGSSRSKCGGRSKISITMRDRSKNRKPLQRGRNLSIEAIHAIQALKRAHCNPTTTDHHHSLERVLASNFRRLLKLDMMAVLRELLRQNECLLALKVFEDIEKEHWYRPQVSLYAEIISVLGSNGMYERLNLLFQKLKMETSLEPDIEGFNELLENLISFNTTGLAIECFYLMKSLGCEPDKSSFKILINGLESKGEAGLSAVLRQEAEKYCGKYLEFLEEKEEPIGS